MKDVTPGDLITFLWVSAVLLGFVLLVWQLIEKIKNARKPAENNEEWKRSVEARLKNDKERLDSLDDGQKAICRGILALLSHEINGNSTDKLKDAQADITNYLIER